MQDGVHCEKTSEMWYIQDRGKDRGPGRRNIDKGNTGEETEKERERNTIARIRLVTYDSFLS